MEADKFERWYGGLYIGGHPTPERNSYLVLYLNFAIINGTLQGEDKLASRLAYRGEWKPYFDYIAARLHNYSSQRDKQKGEAYVHGFTLAMTTQNRFYRPVSEKDTQEGYADIFLFPLLDIYKDMKHSYVIELKYAKGKDSDERIMQLRQEAIAQANRYAASETVQRAIGTTTLHKIVVVYRGMEMSVCEEVASQKKLFFLCLSYFSVPKEQMIISNTLKITWYAFVILNDSEGPVYIYFMLPDSLQYPE